MKSYLSVYRKLHLAILLQLGLTFFQLFKHFQHKNLVLVAQDLCITISSAWNYF